MFSVIIPLYNKEKYITRTIESVLLQTFQDYEIIVIDDGSTDLSVSKVKKFSDERIRLISQKNHGVSAARNRGIEEARFDYIAFLDADDEWTPNHLQEMDVLRQNYPNSKVLATNYKIVDSQGISRFPVNIDTLDLKKDRDILKNYFEVASKTAPPICTDAVTISKQALKTIGGFPIGVKLGEDLLTWARLADKHNIAYSKKITAIYNFKAYSEMLDDEPMPDENDVVGKGLKDLLQRKKNNKQGLRQYLSLWHRMRCNLYIKNKCQGKAIIEIFRSLYYDPFMYKNYVMLILCLLPHALRNSIMKKRLEIQQKVVQ